ncbi:MAG: proline--tRNA ligase [Armatimonadetes bacterium]|nr:proline--tRNA ligase [Armatimonadota bacterium]
MSAKDGLTPRATNFPDWYNDLVLKAGLADYAPVRGCMIIKPHGYAIWELMQRALDDMFKATGHENAYFPLMIPKSFLSKEAAHVEGFAKECAVVTHYRLKLDDKGAVIVDPEAKLEEEMILRPTSETVIWDAYRTWIQSYRDLPVLVNQWANVIRWERRTRLFLRTTEFLWQEGHTAHATFDDAEIESRRMLEVYRVFAEDFMGVPVLTGIKTESEKFAGADHTYCIEALVQDGKAIQAGTSHHLAQNFARAFDVQFQTQDGGREYVYATSWGVSTRLVGTMIMAHSDDKGLVAPPRLAPVQVVILPMGRDEEIRSKTYAAADAMAGELRRSLWRGPDFTPSEYPVEELVGPVPSPIRVKVDKREKESPGVKFYEWELKGACVRVEIGPRDLEAGTCVLARRDTGEKITVPLGDAVSEIDRLLTEIQSGLHARAFAFRQESTRIVNTKAEFEAAFEGEGGAGLVCAHWDGTAETEAMIAEKLRATIRCIPFVPLNADDNEPGVCVMTGNPSKQRVVFARAY